MLCTIFAAMTALAIQIQGYQEPEYPEWVDIEYVAAKECGACGALIEEGRQVLSYDGAEWVPVCDECWGLFAAESAEHRDEMAESY